MIVLKTEMKVLPKNCGDCMFVGCEAYETEQRQLDNYELSEKKWRALVRKLGSRRPKECPLRDYPDSEEGQ